MKLDSLPTGTIDWPKIPASVQPGDSGTATQRTREFEGIRLRLVDYSANYIADHWCRKGHIVFIVAGEVLIEHQQGPPFALTAGMSYHVADDASPHRLASKSGARLLIVD